MSVTVATVDFKNHNFPNIFLFVLYFKKLICLIGHEILSENIKKVFQNWTTTKEKLLQDRISIPRCNGDKELMIT